MQDELSAIDIIVIWDILNIPPNIKPIDCRWIFKIKFHGDGSREIFKSQLVAKGYNQIAGLNYFDTYSLVAKLITIIFAIALTSINNWFIRQLDVNNSFLRCELQEYVYIVIPPGINPLKPNKARKLKNYIYGLKQASKKWYEKLTSTLINHGYVHDNVDHSLLIKKEPCHSLYYWYM